MAITVQIEKFPDYYSWALVSRSDMITNNIWDIQWRSSLKRTDPLTR